MNAALISGFTIGLAGVITQNAWYYFRRRALQVLAYALEIGSGILLIWGAESSRRGFAAVFAVVICAVAALSVAGSLAFTAFMAGVTHTGRDAVVKRMMKRERKP